MNDTVTCRLLLYVCSSLGADFGEALRNPASLLERACTPAQYGRAYAVLTGDELPESLPIADVTHAARDTLATLVDECSEQVAIAKGLLNERLLDVDFDDGTVGADVGLLSSLCKMGAGEFSAALSMSVADMLIWLYVNQQNEVLRKIRG